MTETMGLRERKKRERRRSIEDAAIDLFDRDGFDATTIEAIALAVDIAPRTFFYYFSTKEDVVLADYAARLDRILDELAQQPPTEQPWNALRASFVVVAADYEARRVDLIRRFMIMAANPSVYARSLQLQAGWEDALAQALDQRTGRQSGTIESRLLAAASLACMRSSLRHWLASDGEAALPALLDGCFDRLANGLTVTD